MACSDFLIALYSS